MSKIIGNTVGTPMNPKMFKSKGDIREIVPNEHGVFPIREAGIYHLHIEFATKDDEIGDIYNAFSLHAVTKDGTQGEFFGNIDINSKFYNGLITVPNTVFVEYPDMYGIKVEGTNVISTSITTVNSFVKSTDRQIAELKTALGSYITDIDTLLGGD